MFLLTTFITNIKVAYFYNNWVRCRL